VLWECRTENEALHDDTLDGTSIHVSYCVFLHYTIDQTSSSIERDVDFKGSPAISPSQIEQQVFSTCEYSAAFITPIFVFASVKKQ